MIATSPETERYSIEYERLRSLRGAEPNWLARLRADAFARFEELGFPTTRYEEWKYTSVQPIVETEFRPASLNTGMTAGRIEQTFGTSPVRLVFVNGLYAPQLSSVGSLPQGVTVINMASALATNADGLEPYLGRFAKFRDHAFVALNTALFRDGAFVHIPRGVVVEDPIQLLFIADAADGAYDSHIRNLFVADENSQATLIESHWGKDGQTYFSNIVTEIAVAPRANLDHYKVQEESAQAFHIATQQLEQSETSVFSSHSITFGGGLVRNDINARLGGEHIECTVNGLYVLDGRQHVDNHTAIDHALPNCNSHELYKGIMDGKSTGVFNGKIFVRQDAQKTDAKQTNQNLLLSRDAMIDTKPQLEIYADDVRCTHGATIGQLDADALFYLRTRGIGEAEARAMLVQAFAGDLLNRIKVETLRERLETALMEKLGRQQHQDA